MDCGLHALTPSYDRGNQLDLTNFQSSLTFERQLSEAWNLTAQLIYSSEVLLPPTSVDGRRTPVLHRTALYTNQAQGDVDIDGDLLALPRAAAIVHAGEQHHFKLVYGSASQDNRSARYSEKERIRALDLIYFTRSARWFATVSAYRNWAYNVLSVVQRVDPMTGEYQNEQDNSGRLSIYGAELLASLALVDELRVEGSVTGRTTIDLENPEAEPAYSPHWLAKGRLSYSRWGLTAAATVRFVDGMLPPIEWGSTEGEFNRIGAVVPGYAVLGANLRYDWFDSGFYSNLRASNLTGTGIRYPANELVNFERGAPALDREVLLTVGWQR